MDGTTARGDRPPHDAGRAANRRTAYRVEPADVDDIDLEMLSRRQRLPSARVADVAIGGACLHVDADADDALADGDEVAVAVSSRRHGYENELPARVVHTHADGNAQVVHLSFLGSTRDLADPPPAMFELLNRRASYRGVGDGACTDLQALATPRGSGGSGQAYPVEVRNISNSGVSLGLDADTHAAFEGCTGLRLQLELPGAIDPTRIACRIRYRSEAGDAWVYGCEYDWSETSDSLGVVEDLVAYLLSAGAAE